MSEDPETGGHDLRRYSYDRMAKSLTSTYSGFWRFLFLFFDGAIQGEPITCNLWWAKSMPRERDILVIGSYQGRPTIEHL